MATHAIEARGVELELDLSVGHIASFAVTRDGRRVAPLHRAPWIDEEHGPDVSPGLARLSGDFLCAPFSKSDVEEAPTHGWPGNSAWVLDRSGPVADGFAATFRLERPVMGATVTKTLTLRDDHPFVYQEHRFTDGSGSISVAHHTMAAMEAGGRLTFSTKKLAFTLDEPLETDPARGRNALAYPAETQFPGQFPLSGGGHADLRDYPPAEAHEDFVVLVDRYQTGLGWTALSRKAEGDLLLTLKNRAIFPVTMLWMSNGGRDYAPWNGRHRGVLGIEDGRCSALGHKSSISENRLTRREVPTSFKLWPDEALVVRQVIGAIPLFEGAPGVASLYAEDGMLAIELENGISGRFLYDAEFLETTPAE